eukprot:6616317-Prymnesium_polylepis.1
MPRHDRTRPLLLWTGAPRPCARGSLLLGEGHGLGGLPAARCGAVVAAALHLGLCVRVELPHRLWLLVRAREPIPPHHRVAVIVHKRAVVHVVVGCAARQHTAHA